MTRPALGPNQHTGIPPCQEARSQFDHLPSSSAAIKNEHSCISIPPYGFIAFTEVTAPLPLQI